MLRFACPSCDTTYPATERNDGRLASCRVCKHKFIAMVYNDGMAADPAPTSAPAPGQTPETAVEENAALSDLAGAAHAAGASRFRVKKDRTARIVLVVALILVLGAGGWLLWYTLQNPNWYEDSSLTRHDPGDSRSRLDLGDKPDAPKQASGRVQVDLKLMSFGRRSALVGRVTNAAAKPVTEATVSVKLHGVAGQEVGTRTHTVRYLPAAWALPVRIDLYALESQNLVRYETTSSVKTAPETVAAWQLPRGQLSVVVQDGRAVVTGRVTNRGGVALKDVRIHCDLYDGARRIASGVGVLDAHKVLDPGRSDTFTAGIAGVPLDKPLTPHCRLWAQKAGS